MGLFDFIKNKTKTIKATEDMPKIKENNNKKHLDAIQNKVYEYLKPLGFRKNGRTFNRQTEKGIYQVINLQSGQYSPWDNYVIPGLRENYYGKFAVNLGVLVQELYDLKNHSTTKKIYQEYDCQIRSRLASLVKGKDYWWPITNETNSTATEIIEGLNSTGLLWLDTFETRDKICASWGNISGSSKRAKLDVALIVFQTDKQKAQLLMQEYFNNIDVRSTHRNYVKVLADSLGIPLVDNNSIKP